MGGFPELWVPLLGNKDRSMLGFILGSYSYLGKLPFMDLGGPGDSHSDRQSKVTVTYQHTLALPIKHMTHSPQNCIL